MSNDADLSNNILELVKKTPNTTVREIIEQVEQELEIPQEIVVEHIIQLENNGRLKLSSPIKQMSKNFSSFIFSVEATWFWLMIMMSIFTTISVFWINEKNVPYIYIRNILGTIFVLFIPGYTLIKTLFPRKEIDNTERMALSIGMSLILIPLVGLILNYTPWGIRLIPVTLSISTLTILLSILGIIREYNLITDTWVTIYETPRGREDTILE
jgi:uncharacterized membrane protein